MKYHFFDYKAFIEGYHGQDLFGLTHIIFMILAFLTIIAICYFGRKTSEKKVNIWLKVLTFVMPILEIIKIVWESYYDIKLGGSFNYGGLLPLYTCSMFMYVLPFASFGKGKVKECAYAFLTTIGIIAGLSNFFYLQILNSYPFWTFASFISIHFHFEMVLVGIFLITSNVYRPNYLSVIKGWIPVVIFSLLVIPINYHLLSLNMYPDYMLLMYANGVPLISSLANVLVSNGLQPLFTFIMIILYIGFGAIIVSLYKLILLAINIVKRLFKKSTT